MYKVKICGIKEVKHLDAAITNGAAYVGFVFFERSSRNISIELAQELANMVPKHVYSVALMVDPSDAFIDSVLGKVSIDMIQLHGKETSERVKYVNNLTKLPIMKAFGVRIKEDLDVIKNYEEVADRILIDAKPPKNSKVPGGRGKSFNWDILSGFQCKKPWLLAGGLNAKNVALAIKLTGASQFDVSSGVEDKFGVKSERKIYDFLNTLKGELGAK